MNTGMKLSIGCLITAFTALMLLVDQPAGHPVGKNLCFKTFWMLSWQLM